MVLKRSGALLMWTSSTATMKPGRFALPSAQRQWIGISFVMQDSQFECCVCAFAPVYCVLRVFQVLACVTASSDVHVLWVFWAFVRRHRDSGDVKPGRRPASATTSPTKDATLRTSVAHWWLVLNWRCRKDIEWLTSRLPPCCLSLPQSLLSPLYLLRWWRSALCSTTSSCSTCTSSTTSPIRSSTRSWTRTSATSCSRCSVAGPATHRTSSRENSRRRRDLEMASPAADRAAPAAAGLPTQPTNKMLTTDSAWKQNYAEEIQRKRCISKLPTSVLLSYASTVRT